MDGRHGIGRKQSVVPEANAPALGRSSGDRVLQCADTRYEQSMTQRPPKCEVWRDMWE